MKASVANRVDTAMDLVQPAPKPLLDCSTADSGIEQLSPGDHAMLPLRQSRKNPIRSTRVAFAPNSGVNVNLVRCLVNHAADDAPALRACGATNVKRGSNLPLPPLALIP